MGGRRVLRPTGRARLSEGAAADSSTRCLVREPSRRRLAALLGATDRRELRMMPCENCETPYDPIGTRWKCPHCGFKNHCCG